MQFYNATGDEVTIEDMKAVAGDGYIYIGSPYTKYPARKGMEYAKGEAGLDAAFEEISRICGWCIANGINVYSPIAHTHPIAKYAGMDPKDHNIWLPADKPLMDAARALVVVEMTGWAESYGLKHERRVFTAAGKPVFNLEVK